MRGRQEEGKCARGPRKEKCCHQCEEKDHRIVEARIDGMCVGAARSSVAWKEQISPLLVSRNQENL